MAKLVSTKPEAKKSVKSKTPKSKAENLTKRRTIVKKTAAKSKVSTKTKKAKPVEQTELESVEVEEEIATDDFFADTDELEVDQSDDMDERTEA